MALSDAFGPTMIPLILGALFLILTAAANSLSRRRYYRRLNNS